VGSVLCIRDRAIADSRLLGADDIHVAFAWKDYADGGRAKVMRLAADEFIRRFLLHVLPKGFVRIRHYGLLAGVNVPTKLESCCRLLGAADKPEAKRPAPTWAERVLGWTGQDPRLCPHCQIPLERRSVSATKGATAAAPPQATTSTPQPVGTDSS
jgi:hypothetical protein